MTTQTGISTPTIEPFPLLAPQRPPTIEPAPQPDETWSVPGGTAWVYLANSRMGLVRPTILSDGFDLGSSDLDVLWNGLERGAFPFVSELHDRGKDLVILGYDERSASIMKNAEAAAATIMRAIATRIGAAPLTVGGFSMGGIVTRYTLANLEHQGIDHQTALYASFDSPHRGAWVPVGLQALAHFLRRAFVTGPSQQINSPASRQMLWRHVASESAPAVVDPLRTEFLRRLAEVGNWPRRPRTLGIANGAADGTGNGVPAGVEALGVRSGLFAQTMLRTQAGGVQELVARLRLALPGLPAVERLVHTDEFPEFDGAPGGTLESFGLAGDALRKALNGVDIHHRAGCFVPSVSAVAIRDLDRQEDLYADIDSLPPDESELDDFILSSTNTPHSAMTEEIGTWFLDRLPD
jgi:hypothetical protein